MFKNQIEQVLLVRFKFPLIARSETVLELTDGLCIPSSAFELTRIETRESFSRTFTTSRQSTRCTSSVSVSKKFSATRVPRKRPSSRTSVSASSRCFAHPAPLGDTFGPFFDSSTSGCQTESDQTGRVKSISLAQLRYSLEVWLCCL